MKDKNMDNKVENNKNCDNKCVSVVNKLTLYTVIVKQKRNLDQYFIAA